MATARPLVFMDSAESQIDDLLFRVCTDLQLSPTLYARAETSYGAIGQFLESAPWIAPLKPAIYPQGSIRLNTTVKPVTGEEYDVDLVCEFAVTTAVFRQPVDALDLIEESLKTSAVYRPMIERKNRCIRLNYRGDFHLDILPACRDLHRGGSCILVPDRKLRAWTPSNPKGYSSWFDNRARYRLVAAAFDKAEPVPTQEPVEKKHR